MAATAAPPTQEVPNDDQEYPPPGDVTRPPQAWEAPRAPTLFRLTIPTSWHLDASSALQDAVSTPALLATQTHVANDTHTRGTELFNIRTPYLEVLIRQVTEALPHLPGAAHEENPPPSTGDPELDAFLTGPDHNPYAPFASDLGDLLLLGPVHHPPICTLVLEIEASALKSPHWPRMHRTGLPETVLSDLSAMGLTHLVQILAEEHVARRAHTHSHKGKGGKS